ncbi:MAG: adenylate/guanylate cyclase domain-containing protein, partial [Gemmatimonadetes bacterium]|nr:adenylate/guanylate cyclase domain-containing protein [Gemmatimonadota bacterium]
ALRGHREGLIEPKIAEHHGRIVKLMGDGMLVEFASVVDAVACAVAIQRHMGERNADVPQAKRVEFRMGINLGEVIVEDGDVYGDGVNVAARLEGLADPGGICISGAVYGEVRNRLEAAFADLGEQTVKNIAEPVRVYRLVLDAGAAERAAAQAPAPEPSPPAKASVAVLPFANMSADPEQEYFSDGITEDIITELSRFRSLFVIARNSSFTYKNRAAKVQQVAEDLGVRYV